MANTQRPATGKQQGKSLADIISSATPADEVVPICVAGALIAEHQRLDRELEELQLQRESGARETRKLSGGGSDPAEDRLAKRILKLEAETKANTFDFVFRKLNKNAWRDLMEEYGPRQGKERQERWNPDTFPAAAVRACCVSPEGMDDPEKFQAFWDDVLNDGQRDDLFRGALRVNEGSLSAPFSVSASAHQQSSGPSSPT